MTEQDAIALFNSKFWESLSQYERAKFQLFEARLCMPFGVFHEAIEHALDRPVWAHEFGLNLEGLKREFLKEQAAPTFDEILALIPAEKRMLVTIEQSASKEK